MNRISLDSPLACRRELERTSTGLAMLDHAYTLAQEELTVVEKASEEWNAKAAAEVRGEEKHLTATELNGRVTSWILAHSEASEIRDRLYVVKGELAKLERYYRSLEKRSIAAASANKEHQATERFSGHVNPDAKGA